MYKTGIIRNVDKLGRVVIPKEFRDTLHINEGDAVEISATENAIIISKRSTVQSLKEDIKRIDRAVECSIDALGHVRSYKIAKNLTNIESLLKEAEAES